tara:strand:+ start:225 stop:419 length:195 start_codon:yes stop_codon:yes gene_type:complete
MEKRALAAEERATEVVVMERKARAALEAREKQMANMRVRVSLQIWKNQKKIRERNEPLFWFAAR